MCHLAAGGSRQQRGPRGDPALWHRGPTCVSLWVQMTSGASQVLGDLLPSLLYKVDGGCWLVWLLI